MRHPVFAAVLSALFLGGSLFAGSIPAASADPAQDLALATALKTRHVKSVQFKNMKLQDAVKWLRTATGMNFLVKTAALQKEGIDPDAIEFNLELEDVTIATLLTTLFEPYSIYVKIEGNIVFLTSKAEAAGKPVTRIYAISHITYTKVDFIAPDVNLHPSNYTPPEEYQPEVPNESDPLTSGDAVADLVKELAAPGQWDTEGWNIRGTSRYLIVRAPLSVQKEVQKALRIVAALK
jgi:hypothetical protein